MTVTISVDVNEAKGGRGRPRSRLADLAIREAVLAELLKSSYETLTVDAVARRAEVARTTVYRRYPTKAELVAAAVGAVDPGPHVGTLDLDVVVDPLGEMRRLLQEAAGWYASHPELTLVFARLTAESTSNPEVREIISATPRYLDERLRLLIELAQQRGRLAAVFDTDIALEMILGVLPYRLLVVGTEMTYDVGDRVMDMLFGPPALVATGAETP